METGTEYIGKPAPRVDGRKKVTGKATYTGEFIPQNLVHGYVVGSNIANGRIKTIDTQKAKNTEGVLEVFTHLNLPDSVKVNVDYGDPLAPPGRPFRPLFNDNILYNGQPIALVVAETFEAARYAAGLVQATFEPFRSTTDIRKNLGEATNEDVKSPPAGRGDAENAYTSADRRISLEYYQPRHYHNPMEPHTTVAMWDAKEGAFTIYDKIQGVGSSQEYICGIFGLKAEKVRILSHFVGGAFGSGLRPQYQLFLAAMAAKVLERPVKVALTRRQMFSFGHRPACLQRIKLACDTEGKLVSIRHQAFGETSTYEKYSESVVDWSGMMYSCDNVQLEYSLVPVNIATPMDMRAPGGTTGMFALECAMDELAVEAGMDPLEFRIRNYAEKDQNEDKPFSSKELKNCYRQAADRFGWDGRKSSPRSNKVGHILIGHGMATGAWEAMQQKSAAKAVLNADGHLTVSSATADIGTGTYTVMTQIAAETMGVPLNRVTFELGDTSLPKAPIEGGSWTVSSVGSAVQQVCIDLREDLFALASANFTEDFRYTKKEDFSYGNGQLKIKSGREFSYTEILKKAKKKELRSTTALAPGSKREKYSCYTHSCVMVEVNVDEDLGTIRVPRVVIAVAAGRIINPKTARSQILGGVTWGIGMALEEHGMVDDRSGRIMNSNLAEYHVAIHADVQAIAVIFVEENDSIVNPLGAKGLGEIGIIGVASAVANAVYNATGKRVRDLPITLDKLI